MEPFELMRLPKEAQWSLPERQHLDDAWGAKFGRNEKREMQEVPDQAGGGQISNSGVG